MSDKIPPISPKSKPALPNRRVVALVYDGLCTFEFGCVNEVFGLSRPELGPDWYRFTTCAAERGPLRAAGGLQVIATAGLGALAHAGTIVIPGWKGIDVPPPASLLRALRAAHARGARLASICSGSAVLLATGLLDGKRATTHWRYADALQRSHPRVNIDPNVLYIDEDNILTSAGSAAGLDLCLHIVRRDFGVEIANQIARRLVIPPHRKGGQAQFIERPLPPREDHRLSVLLDRLRARPHESVSVAELASSVAMSERTFLRRFRETTGTTPADWLISTRVERARELLETSTLPIEAIAAGSGFGSAVTLRHHFRRKLGVSPRDYQQRFNRAPTST
ncbi:MAG: transcriptional regulator FtrA [Dokdonella sp.]